LYCPKVTGVLAIWKAGTLTLWRTVSSVEASPSLEPIVKVPPGILTHWVPALPAAAPAERAAPVEPAKTKAA
jgi:hypothetical protein